jgi:hypothetical protein
VVHGTTRALDDLHDDMTGGPAHRRPPFSPSWTRRNQ